MQPAFHRKLLAAFGTLMTDATVSMFDQWQRFAERNQPLAVAAERLRLTLGIAGQALFNIELSDKSHTVGQAVATVNKLLSMLLLTRDEATGQGMNEQQIRDEVMTLLIAGHETVATALTRSWYLLSQHPEIDRRLHSELDEVLGGIYRRWIISTGSLTPAW
jgi:cytochrome P450